MNYPAHILRICLLFVGMIASSILMGADVYVTSTSDSGSGTLREAVDKTVDGDVIRFDPALNGRPILLNTTIFIVNKRVSIIGNGVNETIISGGGRVRVFHISEQSSVKISGVSIVDGYADNYAGIYINRSDLELSHFLIENNHAYARQGGGIGAQVHVRLTMRDGVIAHNSARAWAGGMYTLSSWVRMQNVVVRDNYILYSNYGGGGAGELLSLYSCIIKNSSFLNNTSLTRRMGGGALSVTGSHGFGSPIYITHSTLSGNTSTALAGGVYHEGGAIVMDGVTIANNTASQGGGYASSRGSGADLHLQNSIVAGNTGDSLSRDLYTEGNIFSNGNNLIGNDAGEYFTQRTSDIEGVDPMLQPLKYTIENKAVYPLDPASLAVDAGKVGDLTPDHRGRTIHNGVRDIGAFEVGPPISYLDADGDGFGDSDAPRSGADHQAGYVMNALDNCPSVANEDQSDSDGDGIGDACDDETSTATDNFELTLVCDATVGEAFTLVDTMLTGYLFAAYTGDTVTGPPIPGNARSRIVYTVEDVVPGNYSLVARLFIPSDRRRQHFSYWVRVNGGEWQEWSSQYRGRSWAFHYSGILDGFELIGGTNTIEIAYSYSSNPAIGGLVATIQDRSPVGKFRWCRDRGLPADPPPAPSSTHYLATKCATVGSSFEIETTTTGEVYAVYKGEPTYADPPADVAANRLRFVVPNAIAGNYHIFAHIDAPSSSADSYWVRINDGSWLKWASGLQTQNGFEWRKVMDASFNLKDGRNIIDFAYREPNISLAKLSLNITGALPNDADGQSAIDCGGQPPGDDPGTDPDNPGEDPPGPSDPDPDPEPEEPITAFAGQFHLGIGCAEVGSSFSVTENPADEHLIASYHGTASTSAPPADMADNRIRFTIPNAKAANYTLNALIIAPNSSADSYWVRINDGQWIKWYQGLQTSSFAWKEVVGGPHALKEGKNTIDFAYREPDMQFKMLHLSEDGSSPGPSTPDASTGGCSASPPTTPTDPPAEPPVADNPQDEFWLEAECASVGTSFERLSDGAASESTYVTFRGAATMSAPPADVAANRVRFEIEQAVAGDYQVYARIKAPDGNSDSFWVRVNEGPWIKWASGLGTPTFAWKAVAGGNYSLGQGTNTIDIAYREPNAQLDKLYLQIDGSEPTGMGDSSPANCN